ncbi:uncharacterized protein LOC110429395 [Herrania umbratica]|uniref:Uncharacterized protein LOC110429395 n=1 Tax=Herrania umbratica TaxID=108875 RepID=A0A6J1BNP8_9ROSI|nr:uncharacterized protein LOC110429395 [Herrania umbratica]
MTQSDKSVPPTEDPLSPYFLHHSDHHGLVSIIPKLTATNDITWSRSVELVLSIRNKLDFVDGTVGKPKSTDDLFVSWTKCNNLIVAWLLESISPPIATNMFYMKNATEKFWEMRFAQPDEATICNLHYLLSNLNQGSRAVDEYYTELNGLCEELINHMPLPYCSRGNCNGNCFKMFVDLYQKNSVFKFLNGFNDSSSCLRSHIITSKPFPGLDEVYNLVQREDTQRSIHIRNHPLHEASAMAVLNIDGKRRNMNDQICSHRGKIGHSKDKFYRIIGFPADFKFTGNKNSLRRSNASANSTLLNQDQNEEYLNSSVPQFSLTKHQY